MEVQKYTQIVDVDQLEVLESQFNLQWVGSKSIKGTAAEIVGAKNAPSRDLWQLPPEKLQVEPRLNFRIDTPAYLEHVREIADSIKANGFYQEEPLAGFMALMPDGSNICIIYKGITRLRAALLAQQEGYNLRAVPVSINQMGLNMEKILISMYQGNRHKEYSYYEKSAVCRSLYETNMQPEEIIASLGIGMQMFENHMALMAAPREIRHMVAYEQVSGTQAVECWKKHGHSALSILQETLQTARLAGKSKATPRFAPGAQFNNALKKEAPVLFETLKAVRTDPSFQKLSLETREKLAIILQELESKKVGPVIDAEVADVTKQQALPLSVEAAK